MTGGALAMIARAALSAAWVLVSCSESIAASVNLDAESCRDFLRADTAEVETTLAWLDGYYQEEDVPPVIDFDVLKTNAAKLKAYCAAHGDETVGAAANSLFGGE
jgi:acid stress chaperone HdeB